MNSSLGPPQWTTAALGDIASLESGGTPDTSQQRYYNGGIPWVSISDITKSGKYVRSTERTLTDEGLRVCRAGIHGPNIILFAMYASLGECSIATVPVSTSQAILSISPDPDRIDLGYLYYRLYREKASLSAIGQTGTQKNLNAEMVRGIKVPLPPLHEQRAIAHILSDTDDLIDTLDTYIAKKRDVKTATMQALLSGRKRLGGYIGMWSQQRLGEVATFSKGQGLSKGDLGVGGNVRCIHYGQLFTHYGPVIDTVTHATSMPKQTVWVHHNDVLMPTSDVTPNGLATASALMTSGEQVTVGGDILVIRPDPDVVFGPFLSNTIRYSRVQIMGLVSGTTVYHVYPRDMAEFQLSVPSLDEQRAIAKVLSDMDAEIEVLEQRRAKTCDIKEAMMQELLTGRTRLSDDYIKELNSRPANATPVQPQEVMA